MSENSLPPALSGEQLQLPRYYNRNAAKRLTGYAHQTIFAHVPPDAWAVSVKGDKDYPLWLESTLAAWAAERAARLSGGAA
jgi:hypothetical protein